MELLPLSHEPRPADSVHRQLMIGVGELPAGCVAVSSRILEQQLLSSVHVLEKAEDLWETTVGRPRLTRANPFLDESALSHLDHDGLIREGSRVSVGDVLASIVVAELRSTVLGRARPAEGMQWVADRTWRVPSGWEDAVVASAQRLRRNQLGPRSPQGLLERIHITLSATRPLQLGDVLIVGERPFVVVAALSSAPRDRRGQEADLIVPRSAAAEFGISTERFLSLNTAKATDRAAEALQARSIGPYSLISQQPIGNRPNGGQVVTAAHIGWLAARGYSALTGELASSKSDGLIDRQLLKTLVDAPPGSVVDLPEPSAPQSVAELRAYLLAIGMHVDLQPADGHVSMRIRPARREEILALSAGQVTKSETLHYQSLEPTADGLFAVNIFGPSGWSRRQHFGHIQLAVPIVSILWRIGARSLLSQMTGLNADDIERILTYQVEVLWQDGLATLIEPSRTAGSPAQRSVGSGAPAIRAILAAKGAGSSRTDLSSGDTWLTTDILPVLPPDWRPIILLDSGNFATSDLNDLYRQLINRNNRLSKLLQLRAPQVLLDNEARSLQEAVDCLFANELLPETSASFGSEGRRLRDLLSHVHLRIERLEKRVDWSGAARLVPDASVPADQVLVPQPIFETLRLDNGQPLLLTAAPATGRFVARLPQVHKQLVLRVSPETFHTLGGDLIPAPVAQVHRPVTAAGVAEAWQLLRDQPTRLTVHATEPAGGWIAAGSVPELAECLASATQWAEWTAFQSPQGLMMGGTGSTRLTPDGVEERENDDWRQAPIPPAPAAVFGEPAWDEMLEVARRHLKKTCLFEVRGTRQPPPAALGRLGGEPYLPPEIEWPYVRGKPLPFLGQFPLDAARDAGVLPLVVPPGSMLTVFGGDDCWEPGPCGQRCPIFLHPITNLTARSIPADHECPLPLCSITPRILDEIPDWAEMREILNGELGEIPPPRLRELRERHLTQLASSHDGIKIGGWPKWIQSADATDPLLLQLASPDEADFNFGDAGTLYVFVDPSGQFYCFTQCY